MVRILGSADTWLKDLPDNHGKLMHFSFRFPISVRARCGYSHSSVRTVNYSVTIVQLSVSKVVAESTVRSNTLDVTSSDMV